MTRSEYNRVYGRRYNHRPVRRAKIRKWAKDNPEKMAAIHRRFVKAHPDYHRIKSREWLRSHPEYRRSLDHRRRALLKGAGGSWTAKQWVALVARYGHRCLACGLGEVQLRCLRRKLVPDHVVPLAHSGRNDVSNLQPLCHGTGGCNNRKGTGHTDYR